MRITGFTRFESVTWKNDLPSIGGDRLTGKLNFERPVKMGLDRLHLYGCTWRRAPPTQKLSVEGRGNSSTLSSP